MKTKKLIMGFISLTLLTSCTTGGLNNIIAGVTPNPSVNSSISPDSKGPKLNFTPITKDHEKLISSGSGASGGVTAPMMASPTNMKETVGAPAMMPVPNIIPSAAATSAPMASVAPDFSYGFRSDSGSRSGFYSSWGYYGSGFDDYILSDISEASMEGFVGNFNDTKNKITPYVKDWASDARLIDFNANVDNTGNNISANLTQNDLQNKYDYYFYPDYSFGWMFQYISSDKKEKLIIYVSAKEILYIKQKWTLKDLSTDEILINSNKAIQIVKDAIKNKTFVPVPPEGETVTPITPWWDNSEYKDQYEIIYDIPDDSLWNLYLYKEVTDKYKRIVWNIDVRISFTRPPEKQDTINGANMIIPAPYINSGYAKVDAKTGDILELTRPLKNTPKPYPVPSYYSFPTPWVTATVSPTPSVTESPSSSVSSSPIPTATPTPMP